MTTTGSTTSTSGSSIAVTLGIGSGIDTAALVSQLAAAQKAPKEALITTRETANKAKVSSLATITSTIDSFASALSSLVNGGTLYTQPTSSNATAIGASPITGTRIDSALASSLQVTQLAQGQTLVSGAIADPGAAIGQGTLTLTTASGAHAITIDGSNDSLAGLAQAINDAGAGVTASIVNDGTGARLVVKGAAGAASAFSISADAGAAAGLSRFTYGGSGSGGMAAAQTAQDATVVLDGVAVSRPSNTITDLIPGVKLSLQQVTAAPVAIGASVPTDAITTAMSDFVAAYNEMKSTLDAATASGANGSAAGPFSNDPTLRDMTRQLAQLTATPLVASGSVRTLADLGVRTQQDGTLSLNTTALASVLATKPDAVEALFNPVQTSSSANVQIKSAMGAAAPGTYTLTDMTAGPPPAGKVNGVDMIVAGTRLVAPIASGAGGLVLALTGDVASATITIEPGLGGALKSIRDRLRATTGPLQGLSDALATQAKAIAADRTTMETNTDAYAARLQTTFSTMNSRVSVLKATQSYLEQQIKVWTNDTNG